MKKAIETEKKTILIMEILNIPEKLEKYLEWKFQVSKYLA